MRLNRTPARHLMASVSLLATLGLAGCSEKEAVVPAETCDTAATVRLCPAKTGICLTEHTTLELADGTRLRPNGATWEAYEPMQFEGQVITIGYIRGATITKDGGPGDAHATITCLQDVRQWCGTPDLNNRKRGTLFQKPSF
ncbi:hypothetical protein [Hymenobacter elongatus]|uniref:Lipoprotein n=1 Tax=Hymenobacter elongatus TaxID=877208 RepID=A0A4Z0PPU4_9BACT|nr:hypothetical protein [Hymenobacter elongatus]TGE19727.1 hypothetical protein E5J99_02910 [Hymenobacter elongatus]